MKGKDVRQVRPNKRRTLAKQIREDFKRIERLYADHQFLHLTRLLESRGTIIITSDYHPFGGGRTGLVWKRMTAMGVKRLKLKLISATMSDALGVCGTGAKALDTVAFITYEIGLHSSPVAERWLACGLFLHKLGCPWGGIRAISRDK